MIALLFLTSCAGMIAAYQAGLRQGRDKLWLARQLCRAVGHSRSLHECQYPVEATCLHCSRCGGQATTQQIQDAVEIIWFPEQAAWEPTEAELDKLNEQEAA